MCCIINKEKDFYVFKGDPARAARSKIHPTCCDHNCRKAQFVVPVPVCSSCRQTGMSINYSHRTPQPKSLRSVVFPQVENLLKLWIRQALPLPAATKLCSLWRGLHAALSTWCGIHQVYWAQTEMPSWSLSFLVCQQIPHAQHIKSSCSFLVL